MTRPEPNACLDRAETHLRSGDLESVQRELQAFDLVVRREKSAGDDVDRTSDPSYPESQIREWAERFARLRAEVESEREKIRSELYSLRRSRAFGESEPERGRWIEDQA